jgi:hypothetical protein
MTGGREVAIIVTAFADTLAERALKRIEAAEADAVARNVEIKKDPAVIAAKHLMDSVEHGRTWVRSSLEPPSDSYPHTPFTPAERESVMLCSASSSLAYLLTLDRTLWCGEEC